MRLTSRKQTVSAIILVTLGLVISTTKASADTYLVIANATNETITVNGGSLENKGLAWVPLDAVVGLPSGQKYNLIDTHQHGCGDGNGWLIQSNGPKSTSLCIHLNSGEIGCVLAVVRKNKGDDVPWIDMDKIALGKCSSEWFNANKEDIQQIIENINKSTESVSNLAGSLK